MRGLCGNKEGSCQGIVVNFCLCGEDIIVTDIMGVQVFVDGNKLIGNSSDTATIDISNLANGIYLIQVTTSDGRRAIKKFIKKQ